MRAVAPNPQTASGEALDAFRDLLEAQTEAARLRNRRAELARDTAEVAGQLRDVEHRVATLAGQVETTLTLASGRPKPPEGPASWTGEF